MHRAALVSCIELVLMRRGNADYNLVVAKLGAHYSCTLRDCYRHPDYLRTVLREVYGKDYQSIMDEIKSHLDELATVDEIGDFFRVMEYAEP